MNKTALFLKLVLLLVLPFTLVFLSGCASTQDEQGAGGEPWVGELTGMVEADLKMFFSRIEEEGDVYLVKGTFKGDLKEVEGGYGSGQAVGWREGAAALCAVFLHRAASAHSRRADQPSRRG